MRAIVGVLVLLVGCTTREEGPVVLASNQTTPWTITIDQENLYWLNAGTLGGVYKTPKGGGSSTALYQGPLGAVESLGLDSTSIYFPVDTEETIVAVPIAGGSVRTIATGTKTSGVAVANGNVYWVETGPDPRRPSVAKQVPATGGTPTTIALPSPLMGGAYFTVAGTDGVYASFGLRGGVVRIPFDGSTPTIFQVGEARGLAVDSDHIYFAGADTVDAIPKSGGARSPLASAQGPLGVAIDGESVYLTDVGPRGRLYRVNKVSSAVTVLAENQGAPHAIAVDDTSVYWTSIDEGTIKKTEK